MLIINASKLASILDKNPYTNLYESYRLLWRKSYPSHYYSAVKKFNIKTKDQQVSDELKTMKKEISKILVNDVSTNSETINILNDEIIKDKIEKIEDKEIKERTIKEIKSINNCYYGIKNEQENLNKLEQTLISERTISTDTIKINNRNSDKYIYIDETKKYKIIGLVDGIITLDEEKNIRQIVETKNRKNRLFRRIPQYERIQIICYMKITNINKCLFNENYKGTSWKCEIEFDNNEWEEIDKQIKEIYNYFQKLLNNEEEQRKLLMM